MTQPSDRIRRLRTHLTNAERVGAEIRQAFTQTEDALTVLEDREARRSQRNARDRRDPRDRIGGI